MKNPVRIACDAADIRTQNLPNRSLEHYSYGTPVCPASEEKNQGVLVRTNRLLSFDTTPQTILHRIGNVFTELLPSNDSGI
jgi:hypothetical protein